jgi:CTP synthase
MRLGAYKAILTPGSKINEIYKELEISERHRHRYEVDLSYTDGFKNKGFEFSGMSPDNVLPEVLESVKHKWFIGVQFHPELKSRPLAPHPLFSSFIKHCIK